MVKEVLKETLVLVKNHQHVFQTLLNEVVLVVNEAVVMVKDVLNEALVLVKNNQSRQHVLKHC